MIVITLAVYWQVGNHQFLNFDDDAYVTNNYHVVRGITGKNIIWAFTSTETCNWHPITWLSHLIDVEFYGMSPRGHHLTSVVIHTISAQLLFILLFRLTGTIWQSSFVATLFALHPLHVESVAWVAERKDVLSALFWFLTLILYSEYVAKKKTRLYILSLISFMLGLMSKPMLVTLPIVMLLIDFWPLDRYRHEKRQGVSKPLNKAMSLVIEKIPFFLCSLLSGIVTIYAQGKGGAISALTSVPLQLRGENALIAYTKYIGKTIWPQDLAVLYPFAFFVPHWQAIGSLLILLLLSATAILSARNHPYFMVGWFWFLITLVPVIGLLQVGGQSMADRYSYIPVIGLFIMTAWGVPELAKKLPHRDWILALLAGAVIIASTVLTWLQLGYWHDNTALYRHTLKVTTGNYLIYSNMGLAHQAEGDLDAAINEYQEAIRINPNFKKTHYYLEVALQAKVELDAVIQFYREILRINPNNAGAHKNLGVALASKGDLDTAIQEYREAIRISPNNTDVHYKLGVVLARKRMQDETKK